MRPKNLIQIRKRLRCSQNFQHCTITPITKKVEFLSNSYDFPEYPDRIKVSVLGYRHRSSEVGGLLLENSCFCELDCPLATTASLHCASIVLLLCDAFVLISLHRVRPSRCCHSSSGGVGNALLLTIYTLHIFLLRPL